MGRTRGTDGASAGAIRRGGWLRGGWLRGGWLRGGWVYKRTGYQRARRAYRDRAAREGVIGGGAVSARVAVERAGGGIGRVLVERRHRVQRHASGWVPGGARRRRGPGRSPAVGPADRNRERDDVAVLRQETVADPGGDRAGLGEHSGVVAGPRGAHLGECRAG
jgi:hypothetical protein